jgi:hypothetical protein
MTEEAQGDDPGGTGCASQYEATREMARILREEAQELCLQAHVLKLAAQFEVLRTMRLCFPRELEPV